MPNRWKPWPQPKRLRNAASPGTPRLFQAASQPSPMPSKRRLRARQNRWAARSSSLPACPDRVPPWSSRFSPRIHRWKARANWSICRTCSPRNRGGVASRFRSGCQTCNLRTGSGWASAIWSAPPTGGASVRYSPTSCPTTGSISAPSARCCRRRALWCADAIRWKPAFPAIASRWMPTTAIRARSPTWPVSGATLIAA